MHILAISGSLRHTSTNTNILKACAKLAPPGVEIKLYDGLDKLPYFSPELDTETSIPAPAVKDLREQLKHADAVIFCTPEYAFGVPGSFKNALDWTVGGGEFSQKPVAYITAASVGEKAHESLGFVLTAIGSAVAGSLRIPFIRAKLTAEGTIKDPALNESVREVVDALIHSVGNTL